MLKTVIAAVAVLALISPDATDAKTRKRQKVRVHPPFVAAPTKPARPPGPAWAGPNDCYTDEGYGRYLLCGAGMDM